MDKNTLSQYGWVVICIIVLAIMIGLATPFGNFVKESVMNTTSSFGQKVVGSLDAAGVDIDVGGDNDDGGGDNDEDYVDVPDAEGKTMQAAYQLDFPLFAANNIAKSDMLNNGKLDALGESIVATVTFADDSTQDITLYKGDCTDFKGDIFVRYYNSTLHESASFDSLSLILDARAINRFGFEHNDKYCVLYMEGLGAEFEYEIKSVSVLGVTSNIDTTPTNYYSAQNNLCLDVENVTDIILNFKDGTQEKLETSILGDVCYATNSAFVYDIITPINDVKAEDLVFLFLEDPSGMMGFIKKDKPLETITIVEKIDGELVMSTYDIVTA